MAGSRDKGKKKAPSNSSKRNLSKERERPAASPTPEGPPPEPPKSVELDIPIVSPRDANHYRIIQLHNGLKAILVSTCGYATELAIQETEKEAVNERVCEERPDTSVFNRRRGNKRDVTAEEPAGGKKRSRAAKSNTTGVCVDAKEIEAFDKDQNSGKRGLVGSMIEEMMGLTVEDPPRPEEEVLPTWLPEPEPDEKILEKACRITKGKNPAVEFAINVGAGSMRDTPDMRGRSVLARNFLARTICKLGLKCSIQPFNHTEHATIKVVTNSDDVQKKLAFICDQILKIAVTSKKAFAADIDAIDKYEEHVQCQECWVNPTSDWRRLSLLVSLASEGHPVRNSSPGDPVALWNLTSDKKGSEWEEIESFLQEQYVGSNITFAIKAPESLAKMDEWVTTALDELPIGEVQALTGKPDPYETDEFRKFYRLYCSNPHCCDTGDSHIVITFTLPPEFGMDYKTKPLDYYSDLISYAGPGGLSAYLKAKNLASRVTSGCDCGDTGIQRNKFASLFEVQVTLEEEGLKNVDEVIKGVFAYLKYIREVGPFPGFYDEMKRVRSARFHALEQEVSLDDPFPIQVSQLATWLRDFPPAEVIVAPFLVLRYDEEVIKQAGMFMVPENANYMLCGCTDLDSKEELKVETIFLTEYGIDEISDDQLTLWQNVELLSTEFKEPEPNQFLPEPDAQFCMVQMESEDVRYYKGREDVSPARIWFQQDDSRRHFAVYNAHIVSPVSYSGPHNSVLLNVWHLILEEVLMPITQSAKEAGIDFGIKPTHYGLLLSIYSWNHKIVNVLAAIMNEISEIGSYEEIFKRKKDALLKHMAAEISHEYLSNYAVSQDIFQTITEVDRWSLVDMHGELIKLEYVDFVSFTNQFKETCNFAAFIRGNIVEESAEKLNDIFEANFPTAGRKAMPFARIRRRLYQFLRGERVIKFRTLGVDTEENNVFSFYQVGQQNIKSRVIADFVFDTLKTYTETKSKEIAESKKAIGKKTKKNAQDDDSIFFMSPSLHERQGVTTLSIEAYGSNPTYDLDKMAMLIDQNLDGYNRDVLSKMCLKEYNQIKNRLGKGYLGQDEEEWFSNTKLIGQMNHMYKNLKDLTFRWTDNYCKAEVLDKLTLTDVQNWFKCYLVEDAHEYRALSIRIKGNKSGESKDVVQEETLVEWRERRKSIRDCAFNHHHKLMHAHKPVVLECFKIQFLGEDESLTGEERCEDDVYILDVETFKRKMAKYPVTLNRI